MDIRISHDENNIRVASIVMPHIKTATIGIYVDVGSRNEAQDENGVAHFLEHMAFKGTKKRSAFDIAVEVESMGSVPNAWTSAVRTCYHTTGLGRSLPKAAEILTDIISNSTYDADAIDIEREVILQEIAQQEDDPQSIAFEKWMSTAFSDQTIGRPILGDPEFIKRANTEHFSNFVRQNYTHDNLLVVAAGDVDHSQVVDIARNGLANMPTHKSVKPPKPRYVGGLNIHEEGRYEQVQMILGYKSATIGHPNLYGHKLLAGILGGGMASPLFQEVREKRGLVYGIGSGSEHDVDHGMMFVWAGMTPENTLETLEITLSELQKLTGYVFASDLERARNTALVQCARSPESPQGIANYVATSIFTRNSVFGLDEEMKALQEVSAKDVMEAAQELLESPPTLSFVGPVPDEDWLRLVTA